MRALEAQLAMLYAVAQSLRASVDYAGLTDSHR
jgi:hypothetical protein